MSAGFSVAVLEEDGVQQLQVTEVKAGGMASAKGTHFMHTLTCVKEINLLL